MRNFYLLIVLLLSFSAQAQLNEGLTPEERAYLFHVVKKSPILNNNLGRYFDYQGPEVTFPNGKINYDSVELLIINNPEYLIIRKEEISKSTKGLLAEASNKMAVWELNKVLLAKRKNPNNLKQYQNEFDAFEALLEEKLPSEAYRPKDGQQRPHPKIYNVLNPSLSLDDKVAMVESMRFLNMQERLELLRAMNHAVNEYVKGRTEQIYLHLGGEAEEFDNVLMAAGDGSGTSGLLEEREKNERGMWNRGLPKAVGLFPYDLMLQTIETKRKTTEKIEPARYAIHDFKTAGNNRLTNLHVDVWGYNSEKQTTVVIEKNGRQYLLFGSVDTRFLSPDSSFAEGTTFQAIINDLEFNHIAKLEDKISGRRGYDYWIEYNTKKKNSTEIKLQKKEMEYSNLGYTPITTDSKPSGKVKRSKKKAIKASSETFDGAPTTNSQRSERKKLQDQIVALQGAYDNYKKRIAELEIEKQEAIDRRAVLELRLDQYKALLGQNWMSFTEKDGLYTFEDSSTFDFYTQEFQFPAKELSEDFEVRLLAIPESSLSKNADEVMMHASVMDAEPNYDARINLELNDVFDSDKWDLLQSLFTQEDSVALHVFFESLLEKKMEFTIISRGQGVGKWNGAKTVKNYQPETLDRYPGTPSVSKMDSTFLRLRKSEVLVRIDRDIVLEVNSFTDPVKSNISVSNETILAAMNKYKLSKNDILSAYRTATIMNALQKEINTLAGMYLSREDATKVIDRFNKTWRKVRISVGPTSFKLSEFNL
ncbi:MAG: hypothetical protein DCO96_06945 [Fluviicola sp. XM-24bin1]|nr:MAG: hypothetical protein DCO96_06945 [Fluviicola sp. XM-24bin1]